MSISSVTNTTYQPPSPLAPTAGAGTPFPEAGGVGNSRAGSATAQAASGFSLAQISSDLQSLLLQAQGSRGNNASQARPTSQTASTGAADPAAGGGNVQHHRHHHASGPGDAGDAPARDGSIQQALQAYGSSALSALGTAASAAVI